MTTSSPSPRPLLIGGSSADGCRLLGDYINRLPDYDCGPATHIFCHPKIWNGSGNEWSSSCTESLKKLNSSEGDLLPWCKIRSQNLQPFYLQGLEVYDLLNASNDASELASQLFRVRLIVSGASSWADATPENCFSALPFLNSVPDGQFLFVIENAYSAMARLIKEGFSPKVAAKIWVTESALAAALLKINQSSKRVHLIRLEDLLSEPLSSLEKISQFLASSETDSIELSGSSQLETMPASKREELLVALAHQQADLSPHHRDYLLGTTLKPDVLPKFGYEDNSPSGAELMYQFGYESSLPKWNPVKLSQEEQQLRSPRASFINPFADFKKPPESSLSSEKAPTKSLKSRFSFWKNGGESPHDNSQPLPTPSFPLLPPELLTPPELCNEPDLLPELPDGDLDFAVVIAFFGRHAILDLVVRELVRLRERDFSLCVFLVCSEMRDFQFAEKLRKELGGIGIRSVPNHPLGRKWQSGVDFARESNPKHLVITGSDDLVSTDYLTHAAELLAEDGPAGGFEFAAPASWFLYEVDEKSSLQGSLWELAYQSSHPFPLGAGRVYTSRLLDRFDWQLFDKERDSGLDMQGYFQVKSAKTRLVFIPSPAGVVISIKGNWQALNPTEKILSVPTIQYKNCDFEKNQFFRDHFQTDPVTLRNRIENKIIVSSHCSKFITS